jgi:hypothetical protein
MDISCQGSLASLINPPSQTAVSKVSDADSAYLNMLTLKFGPPSRDRFLVIDDGR